jgi:hypothetical protein
MRKTFTAFSLIIVGLVLSSVDTLAAGNVRLNNEGPVLIHPWFKSSCWDPSFGAPADTWVFFGGVVPGGSFQWDGFYTFLAPGCDDVQFTYTTDLNPPVDPVKGNHRTRFTVTGEENVVLQVGRTLRALQMEALGEHGR